MKKLNDCLVQGVFPHPWKLARVALIPKAGKDHHQPEGYRPICLLPTLRKVLDKLITSRLTYYLEANNILHNNQFGFRKNKDTNVALSEVINFIQQNKINKEITCAVSLDIKNAFNSVGWNHIINLLFKHNIPYYLINIISDFLSDRTILNEANNSILHYNTGVPQGSSLGPILWLLVINELLIDHHITGAKFIVFADDILILKSEKASYKFTNSLQPAFNKVTSWCEEFNLNINPTKSTFILWGIKKITHIPRLKIYNKPIKYVKVMKYLGLHIDNKLNWIHHLEETRTKINKIQYKIITLSKATWGVKPLALKEIYQRATEKIALYGAPIWYRNTQHINNKLNQIQRAALLPITKCYRTVSTDALQVLAGCIPLDLKAQSIKVLFEITKLENSINIGDTTIQGKEIIKEDYIFQEPWKVQNKEWHHHSENQIGEVIFTDGSKISDKVGCSVIIKNIGPPSSTATTSNTYGFRLNNTTTVFNAEAYAIHQAILLSNKTIPVHINSDSRSVLMAIQNSNSNNPIIRNIKENLKHQHNINLYWIKAHIGITGNEEADRAAKDATHKNQVDADLGTPISYVKHLLRNNSIDKWQERWNDSTAGRTTYNYFPRVSTERCWGNFYINQIVTEHGVFRSYQNRFFDKDDSCHCGQDTGNAIHSIFHCALFNEIRNNYFPADFINQGVKELIHNKKAFKGLTKIVKILLEKELEDPI